MIHISGKNMSDRYQERSNKRSPESIYAKTFYKKGCKHEQKRIDHKSKKAERQNIDRQGQQEQYWLKRNVDKSKNYRNNKGSPEAIDTKAR